MLSFFKVGTSPSNRETPDPVCEENAGAVTMGFCFGIKKGGKKREKGGEKKEEERKGKGKERKGKGKEKGKNGIETAAKGPLCQGLRK